MSTVKNQPVSIPTRAEMLERSRPSPCFKPELRARMLAGKKTQTRRIIKPQPDHAHATAGKGYDHGGPYWVWGDDDGEDFYPRTDPIRPPHGGPETIWYLREPLERIADCACYRDNHNLVLGLDGEPVDWRWQRDSLPQIHMPRELARHFVRVTDVRVERLQEISEADAVAEGFTPKVAASVFEKAKGWQEPVAECWIEDDDGGSSGESYCSDCAERVVRRDGGNLCGGVYMANESDGPAYCDECHRPLLMSLSEYGISREFLLEGGTDERKNYPAGGLDASIAHMIADGVGDLQEHHRGRLAQIAFATLWNLLHGPKAWDANPWVFAYAFERVEVADGR